MIVSLKDGARFLGIALVCFCATFICSLFMNFYLDLLPTKEKLSVELLPLYDAQLASAKLTCAISGGFLAAIAVVMLLFYIKLYIDNHGKQIGTLKAMGYSNFAIAKGFTVFGLSVFLGCAAGYGSSWAYMSAMYDAFAIEGLEKLKATFHVSLPIFLVLAPAILFTAISFIYSARVLNKSAVALMRGEDKENKRVKAYGNGEGHFLKDLALGTLKSKKMLAFFVALSCFCFSATIQMGLSMRELSSAAMGVISVLCGVSIAFVSMLMAMTSLIKNNEKSIAVMKATGFFKHEIFVAIFLAYIPIAFSAFALGSVYQYAILKIMVDVVFKEVAAVPEYTFDVPNFFAVLGAFTILYAASFYYYFCRAMRVSVKRIMLEN